MLMKLILFSVLSAIVATEKVRYDNFSLYKLHPANEEQLEFLKDLHENGEGLDFWYPPTRVGDYVSVVSPPDMKEEFENSLKNRDIHPEVMLENIQEAFDAQLQSRRKRDTNATRELFWTAYQTQDEIIEWFHHLAQTYPDVVSVVIGGRSYEGRNITGVRISRGTGLRAMFLEGGQVGADWLSPTVLTYIVDQLVRGEDPEARAATEEFEWHIFPIINPDGFEFSQDSVRLWVKNRRPIGSGIQQTFGVDLTKNWNSQWGVSGGSFTPASDNFIGLGPFSEIETRSLSRYIESIRFRLEGVLSFRQFGQRFLVPFAHTSEALYNFNDVLTVGRRAMGSLAVRYGTQYIVGSSRNVHDGATGTLADWVKHRFNPTLVATYQLRDLGLWGYTLPVVQVQPSCEETFDSLMALLREARFTNML
ncbi:zinc carboxypeptidase-like [Pectinophora gossypiella]|uniref:zinc carboxypeptidase-like n=1 Tax=Pectinophora gossypiella TaxID=13191 RepID=UPI00214E3719|nr:zinc carboxypeptidase-like [Pectinophora gossypiella]